VEESRVAWVVEAYGDDFPLRQGAGKSFRTPEMGSAMAAMRKLLATFKKAL
jgi:hypothetical protein